MVANFGTTLKNVYKKLLKSVNCIKSKTVKLKVLK